MAGHGIDRRAVLTGAAGALTSALVGHARAVRAQGIEARNDVFSACRRERDGSHAAVLFDGDGREFFSVPLPTRGHDCAVRPGGREIVTFARRPGNFAVVFGDTRANPLVITAPPGRHFYGHGVFSSDGHLLYATENDIETSEGRIGVYDATNDYRPLAGFVSGGIGPHDIALIEGGRTLVVANGGIRTHPDHGRRPLNLAEMAPSIAFIDSGNGDFLTRLALPSRLHQVSLRHIATAPGGIVAVAAQYMGPAEDRPDLVYTLRLGGELEGLTLPAATLTGLRNYITSIAIDADGARLAVSSAKGNRVAVVDLASRRLVAEERLTDASGLAPASRGFLVTDGGGGLTKVTGVDAGRQLPAVSGNWDNHVRRVV